MPTTEDNMDAIAESLILTGEGEEAKNESAGTPDEEPELEAQEGQDADEVEASAGDEDEDEGESQEVQEQAPQTFRVKVDGKEVEVTLDELTRGYSGQAYIQRGMREVADARKAVQAAYEQAAAERAQLSQLIAYHQQALQSQGAVPQRPSLDLLRTDPLRYHEERAVYEEWASQQQALAQQQAYLQAQQEAYEAQTRQAQLAEAQQELVRHIPVFADPQRAPAVKRQLIDLATSYGYEQEDLATLSDPRAVRILYRLAELEAQVQGVQSRKEQALQKAQQARPVVLKSGVRKPEVTGKEVEQRKARDRMRKTGSVDDVARFLLT